MKEAIQTLIIVLFVSMSLSCEHVDRGKNVKLFSVFHSNDSYNFSSPAKFGNEISADQVLQDFRYYAVLMDDGSPKSATRLLNGVIIEKFEFDSTGRVTIHENMVQNQKCFMSYSPQSVIIDCLNTLDGIREKSVMQYKNNILVESTTFDHMDNVVSTSIYDYELRKVKEYDAHGSLINEHNMVQGNK